MIFTISGKSFDINRQDIHRVVQDIAPEAFDGRHKYFVEIHGRKYPIKQVIHLATGLSNGDFNKSYASHVLRKLGFAVQSLPPVNSLDTSYREIEEVNDNEETRKFVITLQSDENGFVVASVPALPGCHSQGRGEEEAIANVKEAIRGYIASMRRHGETIPGYTDIREIEVAV